MPASVITLVPIYKPQLEPFEEISLDLSLAAIAGREVVFIGPEGLAFDYYAARYPGRRFMAYEPRFFSSIEGYNHLLLSPSFYRQFADYEFCLILQTDVVLLFDALDLWCREPYDYLGAPWPKAVETLVNLGPFEGERGKLMRIHVGNGGFSLRRNRKCLALLKEFEIAVSVFERTGSSEDLFFSFMGALSTDFVLPNEIVASRFAMEMQPSFYHAVNGRQLPMGAHAWWKYEPQFWLAALPALNDFVRRINP